VTAVESPETAKEKPVSMIVCNHIGFLEILALIASPLHPSFVAKEEIRGSIMGPLTKGLQSLFVQRASQDNKDAVLQQIIARQAQIADQNKPFQPLCLFAEGSTTNGSALMPFKRGAFTAMRPVTPCYIKMGDSLVNPCYDVLDFPVLAVLMLASFSYYTTTLHIMPTFVPNDFMLKKFAHKIKGDAVEPWQIYAWAVRDAMAAASGLAVSELSMHKKIEYEDFMNGRSNFVRHEGVIYNSLTQQDFGEKGIKEPLLSSQDLP
jgi:1-acyl-sn-glycerol-3-phosphate acyltransferase